MQTGEGVTHPIYGSGVVIAIRDRARVKVRFEGREHLPLTVPERDLARRKTTGNPAGQLRPSARNVSALPARATPQTEALRSCSKRSSWSPSP